MPEIFVSYRRDENSVHAFALRAQLAEKFGPDSVFVDFASIKPGERTRAKIKEQLSRCTVILVAIGPNWNALVSGGTRKLDRQDDFVRMEVYEALQRPGLHIMPLLLDGAPMPALEELPSELSDFSALCPIELNLRQNPQLAMNALLLHLEGWIKPKVLTSSSSISSRTATLSVPVKPSWAEDGGSDEFGRWADFVHRGVPQRFRFVESGQFFMGSGAKETGHRAVEAPSHPVSISTGFWLADTPCTQKMWSAVMGTRPSHFRDQNLHPVESVSWNDVVGRFIPTLQAILRAGKFGLPTEAEWEYACRAGSQRAYAWGDELRPNEACFEVGSSEGLPLGGGTTSAVKSFRENGFGLYDMHGNVCEWCDDAPRSYVLERVSDPHGGHEGVRRVVRGGSWNGNFVKARSAYRRVCDRTFCRPFIGFRLKLTST